MELRSKVWIARQGQMVISRGRADLLEAIDASGSISAAARQLDMSYRHAWSMLKASEENAGFALLNRAKGGARGGGANLTEKARGLLKTYRAIESEQQHLTQEQEATHGLRNL